MLSDDEKATVNRLTAQIRKDEPRLTLLDRYYEAEQRIKHIGIAVPPEIRSFETVINVPRMAVDETSRRQKLRGFYRSGALAEDPELRSAWDFNNLGAEAPLLHKETRLFGRAFVAVGSNGEEPERPLITVEDPRQIAVEVDPRTRRMRHALRLYRDELNRSTSATLYLPEETVYLERGPYGWVETDRDQHRLGVVPLVMFLNRRRSGRWSGTSEMADVITKTDAITRLLSVLQLGSETIALPHIFITGATKGDFIDQDGKPLPVWESYMSVLKALESKDAKVHTVTGADLKNFTGAVDSMLAWCAAELGLPTRYAGQQSVNPATEGAIRADQDRLVMNVEGMNAADSAPWSWVMGLEERFRTGSWSERNSIQVKYHDPSTPTYSQRADSVTKMVQVGMLSVEGAWDELGWSEARMQLERERLDRQATNDPLVNALGRPLTTTSDAAAGDRQPLPV